MKAMGSLKKVVVSLVVFALLLTNTVIVRAEINPEHAIIGNNGNKGMSFAGVDSTVITTDLSRESSIPNDAVVNKVETSSHMSPNQGNVRHMLMCQTESAWHTSKVSSATSGSYHISSSDRIPVKQRWSFKYNAKAGAKSSMNSVKLRVDYSYDITSGWNFK